ncbi:hypothetical protein [Kribbella sindirgiensis]|uniref:Uncharacterized protein n=1 Tax=Kribbella sindirgiensis TaxID=1124744 RepID=A0A4R0HWT2_9ACTN|nr:hypothetical protein [Kribbella sindirgiensis]TCC17218.1 hypothetical protein E0H50_39465 [Kribbella sindirgiensis]
MTRRWLIDLPSRIQLWTVEHELRRRPSSDPERLRNLDVLRAYRKSRAFPRNDTTLANTPYFVDRDGRHCAVGHLMRMSGDEDAVRRIAAEANLARIDDMDPAVLADWMQRSGLTKRELARIQPGYPHESQPLVDVLLYTAQLMIPLALLSFVVGRISVHRMALRRGLVVAGLVVCAALTILAMSARNSLAGSPGALELTVWYAAVLGPLVVTAVLVFLARGGRIADESIPSISGLLAGAVGTVLAAVYLVLDVVVPNPTETPPGRLSMGPDQPSFSSPPAVVALLFGFLAVAWSVRALRWGARD